MQPGRNVVARQIMMRDNQDVVILVTFGKLCNSHKPWRWNMENIIRYPHVWTNSQEKRYALAQCSVPQKWGNV